MAFRAVIEIATRSVPHDFLISHADTTEDIGITGEDVREDENADNCGQPLLSSNACAAHRDI